MNERITHIVKEGENLYSIAKKYNTTVQQLIDLNKLHNTVLSVGQNIVISEKDIKEEKTSFDYQQFLKQNLGTGTLKVQTLIGTTYFPIPSVKIEIYKDFNGKSELFFSGYTGDSGYIDGIVLPCPKRRTDYLNGAAIYKIIASHPNYQDVEIEEVYIYDGIKSIQKIEMVPTSYILGKEGLNGK